MVFIFVRALVLTMYIFATFACSHVTIFVHLPVATFFVPEIHRTKVDPETGSRPVSLNMRTNLILKLT